MSKPLAIGALSAEVGVPTHRIRRAIERGFIPEPARAGPYRIFDSADLPSIRAGLVEAGYLPSQPAGLGVAACPC